MITDKKTNKADRHKSRERNSISHCLCLKTQKSKVGPTDRQSDGPTDRPTDRVTYRVAFTRLKIWMKHDMIVRPFSCWRGVRRLIGRFRRDRGKVEEAESPPRIRRRGRKPPRTTWWSSPNAPSPENPGDLDARQYQRAWHHFKRWQHSDKWCVIIMSFSINHSGIYLQIVDFDSVLHQGKSWSQLTVLGQKDLIMVHELMSKL